MKRFGAVLTALLLLLCQAGAVAAGAAENSLVVGNPTPMRGEFFTDMWGNATSDIDVRDLLHGYHRIMWDEGSSTFTVDPSVVSQVVLMENEAGDHTYALVLRDDLYYSDGSRITAWDYAFSYLFSMAPELAEISALPLRNEHIAGAEAYLAGNGPLAGVRVLSDTILYVTLDHAYLPFFYEAGLLSCNPYPISVIAPGVRVRDDGEGVYLCNADPAVTEPVFTSELLRKTVMDEETGYLSHPSVVSGPYVLTAFDGVTAEFEINPYYKGNAAGEKPTIAHLTYTLADNDTMIEQLQSGAFGLLNKVMRTDRIEAGIQSTQDGTLAMADYPRTGLSFISFACEKPTVSSAAVRKAIAYCMDRDAVTADYTGSFGQRVDGFYGIGQWMVGLVNGTLDFTDGAHAETEAAIREEISLDRLIPYTVDLEKAVSLLEEDGWVLNGNGLREKDGVVLDLLLVYPEGNNIEPSLQKNLADNLEKAGIGLTMEAVPMDALLSSWYQQSERKADLMYLATNFELVFDPTVHFGADGSWSYTGCQDTALQEAAEAMRRTDPGDVMNYLRRWVLFQERFNEVLPMLPVYSNRYYDFYTSDLQQYRIAEHITWGEAIVGAELKR